VPILLIAQSAVEAQGVPGSAYQSGFDTPSSTTGWTLDTDTTGVAWAFDGSPTGAPGGPSSSPPNSLNYNNGLDYSFGATTNSGAATTPTISLSPFDPTQPITLVFSCNYETEDFGLTYDQRWLDITNDGFATLLVSAQLATAGATLIDACPSMGAWHTHSVTLDKSWGTIQVRFRFDTIDGIFNNFAGWFVDDFKVTGTIPPPPPPPPPPAPQVAGSFESKDSSFWRSLCGMPQATDGNPAGLIALLILAASAALRFRRA